MKDHGGAGAKGEQAPARTVDLTRIPEVGNRLQARIPSDSHQVVAVYGEGRDSADSTVVLYEKSGSTWEVRRSWHAHNGTKGWTTDHHEGDKRSPVGVFSLTDAGGVLDDPGALLPYDHSAAYQAPRDWARSHWHDFDYVVAINYNRRVGTRRTTRTAPGSDEGRQYLAAHGPRQRYVRVCQRAQVGHGISPADARPASAPCHRDGDKADLKV